MVKTSPVAVQPTSCSGVGKVSVTTTFSQAELKLAQVYVNVSSNSAPLETDAGPDLAPAFQDWTGSNQLSLTRPGSGRSVRVKFKDEELQLS